MTQNNTELPLAELIREWRCPMAKSCSAVPRALLAAALGLAGSVLAQPAAWSQGLAYPNTPRYNYRAGDVYGMNYNWDYMRYGLPGVGVSPYNPIVQAQLNLGMQTAQYDAYNAWAANMYQAANLNNQQAIAQSIENQARAQALEPRYDVRNRTSRVPGAEQPPPPAALPKNKVLSPDGKVLWPGQAPAKGELAGKRAAAEAAILVAAKEFQASGRASVQSVAEAKELLFEYGKPAIKQLGARDRKAAERLLHFCASLEQVLNSLAGV